MFSNKLLNRLTQTHIATPIVIFFVYAVGLLWYTEVATEVSLLAVVGLFLLGALSFTFAEYIVHRWVYHTTAQYFRPVQGGDVQRSRFSPRLP